MEILYENILQMDWRYIVMWIIGGILIYLAIKKDMEPTLLLPIGFGTILVNIPNSGAISRFFQNGVEITQAQYETLKAAGESGLSESEGALTTLFEAGIANELFPLILFIGIGAMIDFGPLLTNPKLMIFGAAAQFGIFFTLCLASIFFDINDAASIAIIGAADGPTSIVVANKLKSQYLPAIMVAAYSYMALVPIIQPPVIKLLTTKKERMIRMEYSGKEVSKATKILFPIVITIIASCVAPESASLIGFLMFGNLIRECGVLNSLSETAQKVLANLLRYRGRCNFREDTQHFPQEEDQPHDRCGRYFRIPHVGAYRSQDGTSGRPSELPSHALHRCKRIRSDRIRYCGRFDPQLLYVIERRINEC